MNRRNCAVGLASVREELAYIATIPVYFARSRRHDEIKIGFSTQVANRLYNLGNSRFTTMDFLGWVPGGPKVEREMHAKFATTSLGREWFAPSPELLDFIDKSTYHDEPDNMASPYGRINDTHYDYLVAMEKRYLQMIEEAA
jgi:hypothetical protein